MGCPGAPCPAHPPSWHAWPVLLRARAAAVIDPNQGKVFRRSPEGRSSSAMSDAGIVPAAGSLMASCICRRLRLYRCRSGVRRPALRTTPATAAIPASPSLGSSRRVGNTIKTISSRHSVAFEISPGGGRAIRRRWRPVWAGRCRRSVIRAMADAPQPRWVVPAERAGVEPPDAQAAGGVWARLARQGCSTLQSRAAPGQGAADGSLGWPARHKPIRVLCVFCGSTFLASPPASDDDPGADCPLAAAAVSKVFNRK